MRTPFPVSSPSRTTFADVVVFLATADARYVVGQLIHVNGGDSHE